jgi:hypothetical protein
MRRAFSIGCFACCAVLTLTLAPLQAAGLRLATFRCDVTPPANGHPLIWLVQVKTVEDPLLAKGVVLDDGTHRYVLCAMDWCGLCNSSHTQLAKSIAAAAGTDMSRVELHTVHQHTAPYTDSDAQRLLDQCPAPPRYVDLKFMDQLATRLADVVREAVGRLEPFDQVGLAHAAVERVASSRRLPVGDGTVMRRMSAAVDPKLRAAPEGNIDPLLRTVTLARGGKALVRMHYYATHPQSFYGDPRASADFVGHAREGLETKEGVFQIYFTGCAGDVACGKYNDRTPRARDELESRLFAAMQTSVAATRLSPAGRIAWHAESLCLPPRTDKGYTEADQRALMTDMKRTPDARARAACNVAYTRRAAQPLRVSLLEIGPVAVLHLPGEALIEFQKFAQRMRPGKFVAVAAYGDVGPGYICYERAFQEGGYEPTASRVAPASEWILKGAICRLFGVPPVAPPPPLRLAIFTADVTAPVGQYLCIGPTKSIEHRLLAKGVVIEDRGRRHVLCAVDWCTLSNSIHTLFQTRLAAAVATQPCYVAVQSVHQHTAPSLDIDGVRLLGGPQDSSRTSTVKFVDEVTTRVAQAAAAACTRLRPFDSLGLAQVKLDRVASCRRVPGPDGKILTRWSSCPDAKLRDMPEGPIDPLLRTITLAAGSTPLVRLHYYGTHPQTFYADSRESYDFPGMARQRLEEEEGVFQIYFTGCGGDVTVGKYNDGSRAARQSLYERMYAALKASAQSTRLSRLDAIQWQTLPVQFTPRTDGQRDPAKCRAVLADAKQPPRERSRAASSLATVERLRKPIELSCVRLGPAWILHLPGEPMNEFQRYAQSLRPRDFVAVAGYGQWCTGYLCTERAFAEGGYEPTATAVVPASEAVLKKAIGKLME